MIAGLRSRSCMKRVGAARGVVGIVVEEVVFC